MLATAALCLAAPSQPHAREQADAARHGAPAALTGRVTDRAAVLTPAQRGMLVTRLAEVEQRTRHQIVIATVTSLDGRDIASYARDLGNDASVGSAVGDKGIVILLAPKEQLVRIAVGRGLEPLLTDALCQQIINEVMLPRFRDGKIFEGLSSAIGAINAKL